MRSITVAGAILATATGVYVAANDADAKVLVLTSENGPNGGVWQATLDFPSKVTDISGACWRSSVPARHLQLASGHLTRWLG